MKHHIDPKVDCVFKKLLGSEENRDLLIHFLNATLGADLPEPIAEVEIPKRLIDGFGFRFRLLFRYTRFPQAFGVFERVEGDSGHMAPRGAVM